MRGEQHAVLHELGKLPILAEDLGLLGCQLVAPTPLEPDPALGRSILAYPARVADPAALRSLPRRELASGLSFPIGFKNGTDGNLQIAIDAMIAARHAHSFLGINREGKTSIIQTTGNPEVHIVLRGSSKKPNYSPEDIAKTEEMLAKAGLPVTIMVDCSHGNSNKDYKKQPQVLENVIQQVLDGAANISGVMIESYLEAGNQKISSDKNQMKYGVSITDACIDWNTTEQILLDAHARLK